MALKAGQTDSETRKKRNYLYQRVFTSERIALEKRLKLVRKKLEHYNIQYINYLNKENLHII